VAIRDLGLLDFIAHPLNCYEGELKSGNTSAAMSYWPESTPPQSEKGCTRYVFPELLDSRGSWKVRPNRRLMMFFIPEIRRGGILAVVLSILKAGVQPQHWKQKTKTSPFLFFLFGIFEKMTDLSRSLGGRTPDIQQTLATLEIWS
jgi:hypothetical protein